MQAIILAAGMGKRLKELTENNTKCMIEVNGMPIIERMLTQLDQFKLSQIVIVIGFKGKELVEYISTMGIKTPIVYVTNEIFYKTNNIYSLYLAKDFLLKEDTVLLESDLIFEQAILQKIINDPSPSLVLVDKYESWMDGTVVTIDSNNNIISFIDKKQFSFNDCKSYYKTVNIYKFSKEFSGSHYVPFLEAYSKALGNNEYYEQVLKVITLLEKPEIKAKVLEGEDWYEIDDIQDLDIAESIFTNSPEEKLEKSQKRFGGYWRYPKLIDFCYLVNPFYPPVKMLDEIKVNFERLICDYPSGIEVNSLLAAKYFGINKENIVVGNGAAELIKSLMQKTEGKFGISLPTFEEYPNRIPSERLVTFTPLNKDFSYSADDLISYFNDKEISLLLLINPDNPSGNYLKKKDVLLIAEWAKKRSVSLIVDESFVDFVESEESETLLNQDILAQFPDLIVIKSISKSYGVAGLRLGVLASKNRTLIDWIKKDVSIWNINSFAEFYLQIFEKYNTEYLSSLENLIEARKALYFKLSEINNLRVIPSQANFIMCEVLGEYTATYLTKEILTEHNLLIKDLSNKNGITGEYIRLAVKSQEENNKLIKAISTTLQ